LADLAGVPGMSYSAERKKARPIITQESLLDLTTRRGARVYPLEGNLIKSNFHLFKKKCAREREEHLAPSSLRHPWGVSRPQGRDSGSIPKLVAPLSIPLRPVVGSPLLLLHGSLQKMSSPLQADVITNAN